MAASSGEITGKTTWPHRLQSGTVSVSIASHSLLPLRYPAHMVKEGILTVFHAQTYESETKLLVAQ